MKQKQQQKVLWKNFPVYKKYKKEGKKVTLETRYYVVKSLQSN